MFNLAIECSASRAAVALCDCGELVEERFLPEDRGSIETLAPTIKTLTAGVSPGYISVTTGPGSFTGLRIGLATAKMLALAWDIPMVGVDTLDIIAEQQKRVLDITPHAMGTVVVPGINAFRNQVFTSAWFWRRDAVWRRLSNSQVVDAPTWMHDPLATFNVADAHLHIPSTAQVIVSGPVLERYTPCSESSRGGRLLTIAPAEHWTPRAAIVGALGWQAFVAGLATSADLLSANYVRASAAEDKQKNSKSTANGTAG